MPKAIFPVQEHQSFSMFLVLSTLMPTHVLPNPKSIHVTALISTCPQELPEHMIQRSSDMNTGLS